MRRAVQPKYDKAEEQVGRIMRAAVELIRDSESLDLRVTDVITAAGVSNRAFYRHFANKSELLIAILEEGNRVDAARLERQMADAPTELEKVCCWVRGMLARARDPARAAGTRPFLLNGLRLAYELPEEWRDAEEVHRAPLRAAVVSAHAAGEIGELDVKRAVDHIVWLTFGQMAWSLLEREPLSEADVDDIVAFVVAGLRRDGPA